MTAQELVDEIRDEKCPTFTFYLSNDEAIEMVEEHVKDTQRECLEILRDWLTFADGFWEYDGPGGHWLGTIAKRTRLVLGDEA